MKKKWIESIVMLALLMFSITLSAQEQALYTALKSKDFSAVSPVLDKRIELCIDDEQDLYSKSTAIRMLKSWLNKVQVQTVKSMHEGKSGKDGSQYEVAKVETKDKPYRLFVYIEKEEGKAVIKKIQLDIY